MLNSDGELRATLVIGKRMLRVKSDKSDWLTLRNKFSAHAQKVRPSQRSRFLVLTKRSAASGDEYADTALLS